MTGEKSHRNYSDISSNERLRIAREELGISQKLLSELVNTRQTIISDIENGRRAFSIKMIHKVKSALNLSLDWLLGGVGLTGNRELDQKLGLTPEIINKPNSDTVISIDEQKLQSKIDSLYVKLKNVYNDCSLLSETLYYYAPPKRIKDKFPLLPAFEEYHKKQLNDFVDFSSHLNELEKKFVLANEYYPELIEGLYNYLSKLIYYFNRNKDKLSNPSHNNRKN